MTRACLALVFALTAVACGPRQFESLCKAIPTPEGCGKPCDTTTSCDTGYFCSPAGTCDIQCTLGGPQCGDDYVCTSDGRCVGEDKDPMNGPDMNCPAVNFTPMPTTPSIHLLLDRSGSMNTRDAGAGTPTRYESLHNALTNATDGVVTQLQGKAYFGASLYHDTAPCPTLTTVARSLNNRNAIDMLIDNGAPGGATPTARSITQLVEYFNANKPPAGSPPAIVLASDGLPNDCGSNTPNTGASVQAARAAYAAGIPVYVLGVSADIAAGHLQDMANAGAGVQAGQPNAPYYVATTAAQLKAAFDTIIKGVISCDLSLTSSIDPNQAQSGTVIINGMTLTYGTDWILVNGNIIRILGNACTSLKTATNPMVAAQFPCGAVIF